MRCTSALGRHEALRSAAAAKVVASTDRSVGRRGPGRTDNLTTPRVVRSPRSGTLRRAAFRFRPVRVQLRADPERIYFLNNPIFEWVNHASTRSPAHSHVRPLARHSSAHPSVRQSSHPPVPPARSSRTNRTGSVCRLPVAPRKSAPVETGVWKGARRGGGFSVHYDGAIPVRLIIAAPQHPERTPSPTRHRTAGSFVSNPPAVPILPGGCAAGARRVRRGCAAGVAPTNHQTFD